RMEIHALVSAVAERCLKKCRYTRPDLDKGAKSFSAHVARVKVPYAHVAFHETIFDGMVPIFHLGLPMNWLGNVYRQNRPVIEGDFVLDVQGARAFVLSQQGVTFTTTWRPIRKRSKKP